MNSTMSQGVKGNTESSSPDEVARLQALYQCHILDTAPEKTFDGITTLAAYICQTPIAYISLVDTRRQWFKSKVGITTTETPRRFSFCTHTISQSDIFIIPDTLADERFATSPLVTSDPYIRFYAGVPLTTVEGYSIGALCVMDYVPRELTFAQVEALRKLALQTIQLIELRRNLGELDSATTRRQKIKQGSSFLKNVAAGFGLASLILIIISIVSYRNLNGLIRTYNQATNSHEILEKLEAVVSQMKDVETGQRGYVITGQDNYLEPYNAATASVTQQLEELRYLIGSDPKYQQHLKKLESLIQQRIAVSQYVIDTRKKFDFETAKKFMLLGRGKRLMNEIRQTIHEFEQQENAILQQRSRQAQANSYFTVSAFTAGIILNLCLLCAVYYFTYREINQRQQTELILEQERDFTSAVINTSGALVLVTDTQGKIVRFNQACEKLTGYLFSEVRGKTFWNLVISPEDVAQAIALFRQVQVEFPQQCENYWITKNGDRHLIAWSNTTLLDADGVVEYIISTGIDITEQKQIEATLRQTNTLQTAILDSTSYTVISTSIDGTICTFNRAAEKLLGYSAQEIVGKTTPVIFHDLQEIVQRSQALSAMGIHVTPGFDVFVAQARRGEIDEQEWTYIRKDGSQFPVLLSITALRDIDGNITGFLGIGSDITERKQAVEALRTSEARLNFTLEAAQMGIWNWDMLTHQVTFSERLALIFGFPPALRCATYQEFINVMHPDDRTIVEQSITRAVEGDGNYQVEFRIFLSDHTIHWIGSQGQVYYDDTHQATRLVGVSMDITERKLTEQALQQANAKLTGWVSELEERNREITLLGEMSEILQACQTVEEAYKTLPSLVQPLFPKLSGGIFLINASRNIVEAVATWGSISSSHTLFKSDDCWALRRGRLHYVENTHTGLVCQHLDCTGSSSVEYLCVPMMAQGEALGLLHLGCSELGLTQGKKQLAITVAEHIGWALANLKLREKLQNHSIRDALTNLFNRRYMEESLERELFRCDRKEQPLGVIMIDVDHFKRFNDTFGHEAGDVVLREIGLFVQNNIRKSDIACRYGGEELMLILPESSLDVVQQRAEQIREGVKHLRIQHRQQLLGTVTLSLGIACFPQHGSTPEALIQAADAALYHAKTTGRDRVVTA
ncbi:diguanylate cyclase with PAS/PAC and GAF sensors [Gloeocapsa sp. PCC 7428]|uniref:diguanylate cyclase n=1 Tax=Gloeocapsa sp. PCC 7428 TaxID=1173026 RepID=UPI0002A5E9D0|nr:diguanylate cyclase [Gloeocapsa sp. PCC 7428]AFZ32289.1 diguanylate cyclase with PAS/PAC and GAF sensors [Gloeocapsa sp. PCC 7428]